MAVPRPDRPDDAPKNFTFDAVYDKDTLQKNFYDESAYPIVESVLQGFNGTIFAYGQTGCGKTHTMQGYADPPEMRGVIPNSFDHVFEAVRADGGKNQYLIRCSYLEIYNEDIHDLLGADVKVGGGACCTLRVVALFTPPALGFAHAQNAWCRCPAQPRAEGDTG